MKLRTALAALLIVAPMIGATQASASTITDVITFSIGGSYPVNGHGPYEGGATATGSFDITFDPTQVYSKQSITGYITDLTYSVTDPRYGTGSNPLSLGSIVDFSYAYGTLDLFTAGVHNNGNGGPDLNLHGTNLVIGINGWGDTPAADVWYSDSRRWGWDRHHGETITESGSASISAVPLPAALPMFGAALAGVGAFGIRRRRKA